MTGALAIGAALVLALAALWLGHAWGIRRGRAEGAAERAAESVNRARAANAIEEDIARLGDAELDERLRRDARC